MIQFNHFNFNVVDLDRSLTFYRDALGPGAGAAQDQRRTAPSSWCTWEMGRPGFSWS